MKRPRDNGSDGAPDDSILNTTNGNDYYKTVRPSLGWPALAVLTTPKLRDVRGGSGGRRGRGGRGGRGGRPCPAPRLGGARGGRLHRRRQRPPGQLPPAGRPCQPCRTPPHLPATAPCYGAGAPPL